MTAKRLPAVEVEWIDSMGASGWQKYEESDMIVLCLNQSAYSQGDYMEIPKSAIKRVTRLRGNMPHKGKSPNYPSRPGHPKRKRK